MREDETGGPRARWRSHPFIRRITGSGVHLSAAVLLATGAVGSFAAQRRTSDNNAEHRDHADGEKTRGDREHGDDNSAGGHDRSRDRAVQREDHKDHQGNGAGKDGSGSGDGTEKAQNRGGRRSDHDETSDIGAEARKNPTPTPTPKNDTSGGGGGGGGNAGGGNGNGGGQGNAGNNLSDGPLATKAGRRANDAANPDGDANAQNEGISFTSGPEGVEIRTNNIVYTAAPTPTEPAGRPGRSGSDNAPVNSGDPSGGNNTMEFTS